MTDHSFLEAERARIFSGEDRDLYLHVGYFFTWYNHVEWVLINVMALVMGDKDLSAFHVLVKRIDGQAKTRLVSSHRALAAPSSGRRILLRRRFNRRHRIGIILADANLEHAL
jgi:hypothetical protein